MFTSIGSVMQIAYLVEDLDQAIAHWAKLGVGPFFVSRNIAYVEQTYRGEKASFEIAAAFAYFGDMQLELVQRLNDLPSIYKEFQEQQGFGVQHLGILSYDIRKDVEALEAAGYEQIQRMVSTIGVETIFFNTGDNFGSVIELIDANPQVVDGFAQMKAGTEAWEPSMSIIIEI